MLPHTLTIHELTAKLSAKQITAREAIQACLDRIAAVDGCLNAFNSHDADDALAQADAADTAIAAGESKPLLGVPIAIKDVIAVKGQLLTCSSKILGEFNSPYEATVITKLRDAGAIIFGRL